MVSDVGEQVLAERRRMLSRAQSIALRALKNRHPEEFREILRSVYEEQGIDVRKRRTRDEILADQIAEAKRLLAEHQ